MIRLRISKGIVTLHPILFNTLQISLSAIYSFLLAIWSLYSFIILMSLKQFEIITKLGSGSFGVVFKVRRKDNGQVCVLKEVQMKKMDKKMKQWALNEAKIMKNIQSPYIVKYFNSFIEKEKFYICMEYCSGGDLAQFLKGQMGKPVNEDVIWRFTLQIMLGLKDLHAKKILHRDIKSMNVFLTDNKSIRIGDLGVARTMTGDFASTIVGTPYYLSPEMCEEKPYNEKTDVWAMGCLIYQLCTSKHPFEANSQAALALKIVVGKYSPIPSHYSQSLSWLIRLCLSVDYKRRPSIEYLLQQQSVIEQAKKQGIELHPQKNVEKQPQPLKQTEKPVVVEKKEQPQVGKIVVQKPVAIKKNDFVKKPAIERKSAERIKERSLDRQKVAAKEVKKEVKAQPQPQPKYMPPKDKQQAPKKIEQKEKPQIKQLSDLPKQQEKRVEKPIEPQAIQKKAINKQTKPFDQNDNIDLLIHSKPKKSVQEIVDDDELFKDFGITPEKITLMQQKVEFKKVNTINWNVMNQPSKNNSSTESDFVQLPTIKTPSSCEIVAVECKQIDEEEVAEEIDDNVPYKSDEESISDKDGDDTLLLEDLPDEVEEEGQLMLKENLLLLQRKIYENQKRKKELIELKRQYQGEILQKTNKAQYERLKCLIRQDSQGDIEKAMAKQLQGANVVKFIKIYHYEIEIQRCDRNIDKWREKVAQMSSKKY